MSKRQPVNTVAGAAAVASAIGRTIEPPAHVPLDEDDLLFWDDVIAEKPALEWTQHDLTIAAMLVRAMADEVKARTKLRETGGAGVEVKDKDGNITIKNNAYSQAVRDEAARIISYRTTLQIHGRGKNGEKRDVDRRRSLASEIEGNISEARKSDLMTRRH
ncbi:MAG: terminase small subunit [Alphaproteobacteria bacterium PA1]|nr:MAG: terminase small subunit [Alphaproteobacteria bacterium PA1]